MYISHVYELIDKMEAAPDIVMKLWGVSHDDAKMWCEKNVAWDSCVDGMRAIYPTLSFEEALVLVIHYENPMNDKPKDCNIEFIKCDWNMREYIRTEIKKLCMIHTTCVFEEWFILAKYNYLKI